jgi:hypothetical protein
MTEESPVKKTRKCTQKPVKRAKKINLGMYTGRFQGTSKSA